MKFLSNMSVTRNVSRRLTFAEAHGVDKPGNSKEFWIVPAEAYDVIDGFQVQRRTLTDVDVAQVNRPEEKVVYIVYKLLQ